MRRILVIATVLVFFHGQLFAYDAEVNGDVDSNGAYDIAFGGTNATTAAGVRTNLSLVSGINVQAYDADLTTYAGITPSANVQTFLGYADFAAMRTGLGLAIGTNVQAYSAYLDPTSSVQDQLDGKEAADADIAKTDVAETVTGAWTFEDVPVFEAGFTMAGTASGPQSATFYEDSDNGTNYVGIGSPASNTNDLILLLPSSDPTTGQLLSCAAPSSVTFSDGVARDASVCSWADAASGAGDLLADGTIPLTANWDVGAFTLTGVRFISDVATGTAPFGVSSTTVVPNLNVSLLEGHAASYFQVALTNPVVQANFGANVYTFLGTPSSSNFFSAISDEGPFASTLFGYADAAAVLAGIGAEPAGITESDISDLGAYIETEADPTVDTSSEVVTIINTTPSTLIAAAAIHGDIARDTELTAGTADWATTGTITGKIETATDANAHTFTSDEYHGGLVIATGAGIYTLPSAVAGYSGCVRAGQGVTAIIQLLPATGDYLVLDGVRGAAATALASDGSAGDKICFTAANTNDWYVDVVGTWEE